MTKKELSDLFKNTDRDVKDDDNDLTVAIEKASSAERGDVWIVCRHRTMYSDATNPDDVKKLMDGKWANLILTDLPY